MVVRTRQIGMNVPHASGFTWRSSPDNVPGETTGDHPWQISGTSFLPLPEEMSTFVDIVGEGRGFHPCYHSTVRSQTGTVRDYLRTPQNVMAVISSPKDLKTLAFPDVPTRKSLIELPWTPRLSSAKISDYSIEAFNKFHDQVPTTVSLANFIYELKDMKGMIPSIDKKSLTKTASNNFLAFEFGVLPFISDVKAIVNLSNSVDERIKHLISTQNRTTNLSFNRQTDFNGPDLSFNLGLWYANSLDIAYIRFEGISGKVNFHIGGKLVQDLSDLTDAMAKMKGLIASGGFNHPARVIWNAIPYSFVVDWFFHVGKLLDSLTVQPFGGQYDVVDVGWSTKSEASYIVHQVVTNTDVPVDIIIGTVGANEYSRSLGFPASSLFLTDGILSPTQLVLALSMLEQRRH